MKAKLESFNAGLAKDCRASTCLAEGVVCLYGDKLELCDDAGCPMKCPPLGAYQSKNMADILPVDKPGAAWDGSLNVPWLGENGMLAEDETKKAKNPARPNVQSPHPDRFQRESLDCAHAISSVLVNLDAVTINARNQTPIFHDAIFHDGSLSRCHSVDFCLACFPGAIAPGQPRTSHQSDYRFFETGFMDVEGKVFAGHFAWVGGLECPIIKV